MTQHQANSSSARMQQPSRKTTNPPTTQLHSHKTQNRAFLGCTGAPGVASEADAETTQSPTSGDAAEARSWI
jgi:hypothetical protein